MGIPRRRKNETVELSEYAAEINSAVAVDVPSLCEFLARQCWDDGEIRERGSILLVAQEGVWKGWVNDRDGNRSAWVSATSLCDLLALIDQGLEQDALPWRRGTVPDSRKKKS